MLSYSSGVVKAFSRDYRNLAAIACKKKIVLAQNTTYGLGGEAEAYFPSSIAAAKAVCGYLSSRGSKIFYLGCGSNVLASDSGYDGGVICTRRLKGIVRAGDGEIFCLAGTTVAQILNYCVQNGLGGLEYLAGIPATIGGIVAMNGGAGGRYICQNVVSVKIFDGKTRTLSNKNCNFEYKQSTMRNINALILAIRLSVFDDLPNNVALRISEYMQRRVKLPKGRSCGCVFKNVRLKDGSLMSAGALIQRCGLAGFGHEKAFVSAEHCNFIINNGYSASTVRAVIDDVKEIVFKKLGVMLEEEVVYCGKF